MRFFFVFAFFLLQGSFAFAQSNATDMKSYIRQENNSWSLAYAHYGSECLKNLDGGQLVPAEISVETMNCYIRKIHEYVAPQSQTKEELNALIDDWFQDAVDHQNGVIDDKTSEKQNIKAWERYVKARDKKLEKLYKLGRPE